MKKSIILICGILCACNSAYVKDNTMVPGSTIFADRGGYGMKRSIKEQLENHGYRVIVGTAKSVRDLESNEALESINLESIKIPQNARYVVKVSERQETLQSFFCPLSGFWWWNFNVSIADQATGEELLSWRGRGCANSELRRLNEVLDRLKAY